MSLIFHFQNALVLDSLSPQCGNFRIFQSLRFYVKSILGILEVQILQFLAIFWVMNFANFWNFSTQKSAKIHKNPNSEPLNVLKWQILHFWNLQKLISHKTRVIEKWWNFHTVCKLTWFLTFFAGFTKEVLCWPQSNASTIDHYLDSFGVIFEKISIFLRFSLIEYQLDPSPMPVP